MASPRLSDLLAVAITLSRTPQDERRNPGPDPSDESRQSALGRPSHSPRIHGELLKLGIDVSQATVGRHLPRRSKAPSPTWRSFRRNHMTAIAAVDMFTVATVTRKLLYAVIVLSHHRRRVIHFEVLLHSPIGIFFQSTVITLFVPHWTGDNKFASLRLLTSRFNRPLAQKIKFIFVQAPFES
jgi:hypothetical protein